jgi:hypothetical protein
MMPAHQPSQMASPPPRGTMPRCSERAFGRSNGNPPVRPSKRRAIPDTTAAINAGNSIDIRGRLRKNGPDREIRPPSRYLHPFFARLARQTPQRRRSENYTRSHARAALSAKGIPCCN